MEQIIPNVLNIYIKKLHCLTIKAYLDNSKIEKAAIFKWVKM